MYNSGEVTVWPVNIVGKDLLYHSVRCSVDSFVSSWPTCRYFEPSFGASTKKGIILILYARAICNSSLVETFVVIIVKTNVLRLMIVVNKRIQLNQIRLIELESPSQCTSKAK